MNFEIELLQACLSANKNKISTEKLNQVSNAEWQKIFKQSIRFGVAPLIYESLKPFVSDISIPKKIKQNLREIYLHSTAKNVRLYHELSKVLFELHKAGIPVIVLKAAHLAEIVCDDIALRPMVDIDLLVQKKYLSPDVQKFQEMDYVPERHFWIEAECETHHHLPAFSKPGATAIEIHWSIARPIVPLKIDVDGLWKRAQPIKISGIETLVLSPEDLLLHLCLHISFFNQFTDGLRSFCDIAVTIQHYKERLDWEQTRFYAQEWGVSKCLYISLYFARKLLDVNISEDILDTLKPGYIDPKLMIWAKEQIFADQNSVQTIDRIQAQILGANRLRNKVSAFLKLAFCNALQYLDR